MATWLRQPTGDGEGQGPNEETAVVRWVAAGHLTTKEGLADPNFPISRNDPHPDYGAGDPRRCRTIRIDATGFRLMSVTANFEIPINGEFEEEPSETNPLIYSWQTVQESVPVDRDIDGNPVLTSARRGLAGVNRPKNAKRLTITRWESGYNPSVALAWENSVNDATFEGAAAEEVSLQVIQPSTTYTELSTLLPIDYTFLFKKIDIDGKNIWGPYPHQLWILDKDSVAYATVDAADIPVRITTKDGTLVQDVLLDGEGRPVNQAEYTYLNPLTGLPEASPTWVSAGTPAGATKVAAGDAVFLRWSNLPALDYSELGF